jgi:hypothetical protein
MTLDWLIRNRWLVAVLVGGAMLVVGVVVRRLRDRLAVARLTAADRGALGESVGRLEAENAGEVVTVRGTLVVEEGELVPELLSAHEVAAVSLHAAVSLTRTKEATGGAHLDHRAERLVLRTERKDVDLLGSIRVLVGSRHRLERRLDRGDSMVRAHVDEPAYMHAGWDLMRPRAGEARSISDGDAVLVRGKLARQHGGGDESGYRQAATRWALTTEDEDGRLLAAALERPKLRASWRLYGPAIGLGIGVALITGLFFEVRAPRAFKKGGGWCSRVCRAHGRCFPTAGIMFGMAPDCVAQSTEHCRASAGCRDEGYCTALDGHCAATSEKECAASQDCRSWMQCELGNGECIASAERCASGHPCRNLGLCDFNGRHCAATSDADCAKSSICDLHDQCVARGGRCRKPEGFCQKAQDCADFGRCSVDEATDRCVLRRDADCRKSDACRKDGRCSVVVHRLHSGLQGSCIATRDEDCAATTVCSKEGRCAVRDGSCAPTKDEHCAASEACRTHGKCTVIKGRCHADSLGDCRRASAYRAYRDDEVSLKAGRCEVPRRPSWEASKLHGKVARSSGALGIAPGAPCTLDIEPTPDSTFNCRMMIRCGGRRLYGDLRTNGYNNCNLEKGSVVGFHDPSPDDGDPAAFFDAAKGVAWVKEPAWEVHLEVQAAPSR